MRTWILEHWILLFTIFVGIGAILILRKALKDADDDSNEWQTAMYNDIYEGKSLRETEEFSPEAYFGEDEKEIEAYKKRLIRFEDVNDQNETDLSFFNKCQ